MSRYLFCLPIIAAVLLSACIAVGSALFVRHTLQVTLTTTDALADARRDIDDIRESFAAQKRALLTYGRTGKVAALLNYRLTAYDAVTVSAAQHFHAAGASQAVYHLLLARNLHTRWMQRNDAALTADASALSPYRFSHASMRKAWHLLDDMDHTSNAVDAQLADMRGILDTREAQLHQDANETLPIGVALVAFVALSLMLTSVSALVFWRRFFLERMRSHRLATAFGNAGLPDDPRMTFDGVLKPLSRGDLVGGDWYDARPLPDGRVFLTIGDVAGHGVEAAIATAHVRRALLGAAIGEADPAAVLRRVNSEHNASGLVHVATLCAYYDPANRELVYASAGLPAPLLRDGDSARFLAYGGPPLGVCREYDYESHRESLPPSATLVLYTDGVIEQSHDTFDGEETLHEAVLGIADDRFAHRLYQALFSGVAQKDDVAILSLQASP